jgi:hypothetical protein
MNFKTTCLTGIFALGLLFVACSDDDGTSAPQPEPLVTVDPEVEQTLDQQNPLGFKYDLQNNQLTFVKLFESYTNDANEADFFGREDADALAQKFHDLIPYDIRKEIPFLYLTGSRPTGEAFAGFVQSIHTNANTHWLLALGIGSYIFGDDNQREQQLMHTSIHEFAHVKTANHQQAYPSQSGCAQGELDSGQKCFEADSYMTNFYNTFWEAILTEWQMDNEVYYQVHQEDFVTGYASSNFFEDFAESFTFFVLEENRRTGNTMADQKVNFFYNFSYWTEIRNTIRENL